MMEDAFTRMQKRLSAGCNRIEHLDADLAALDDHISVIDRKFSALDAQFEHICEHYDEMLARISAIDADTEKTRELGEELRRRTMDIAGKMTALAAEDPALIRSASTSSSIHPRTKSPHP